MYILQRGRTHDCGVRRRSVELAEMYNIYSHDTPQYFWPHSVCIVRLRNPQVSGYDISVLKGSVDILLSRPATLTQDFSQNRASTLTEMRESLFSAEAWWITASSNRALGKSLHWFHNRIPRRRTPKWICLTGRTDATDVGGRVSSRRWWFHGCSKTVLSMLWIRIPEVIKKMYK